MMGFLAAMGAPKQTWRVLWQIGLRLGIIRGRECETLSSYSLFTKSDREVQALEEKLTQLEALLTPVSEAGNGGRESGVNDGMRQSGGAGCAVRPGNGSQ
jgi:hypothetical protein